MEEAAHLKLKDNLWSAKVADRVKKEIANAILKYQNQDRCNC